MQCSDEGEVRPTKKIQKAKFTFKVFKENHSLDVSVLAIDEAEANTRLAKLVDVTAYQTVLKGITEE